ncbi:hypothetical protein OG413_15520 [Streptomyces sp. NBC_01433]|uniref:hypothetical protein n=1 Tax=Streptomyces sp. NBC_01433 TaxID=2903864 RepID=UPI00225648CD|nr:hypothetical protein [Streptomyces sp. NBC_01433]MCX4676693.1 hypothetical protein [Streptomyces sp. NBC_01433]
MLTWRELGGYLRQLPPRARTRIAMGDKDGLWGLAEHLQGLTIDELRIANWQRSNEGVRQSKQSKRPTPITRPGTGPKAADKNSPQRIARRNAAKVRAAHRRSAIARGEIT